MKTHLQESTYCEEAREAMSDNRRDRRHEGGFALILAILALMLLTFLGLTLATTTSTELRIATNYRWNTQALYNAEAGIEAGKRILQGLSWLQVLPAKRADWTPSTGLPLSAPVTPFPGRHDGHTNFEMGDCDRQGNGMGWPRPVRRPHRRLIPYENDVVPDWPRPRPNGAFTCGSAPLVRGTVRELADDDDGGLNDTMILTAEGIAPYNGASARSRGQCVPHHRGLGAEAMQRALRDARPDRVAARERRNVFGGSCGSSVDNALKASHRERSEPGTRSPLV